jgi:hypothetical protein
VKSCTSGAVIGSTSLRVHARALRLRQRELIDAVDRMKAGDRIVLRAAGRAQRDATEILAEIEALTAELAELKALLTTPNRPERETPGVQAKTNDAPFYGGDDRYTYVGSDDADRATYVNVDEINAKDNPVHVARNLPNLDAPVRRNIEDLEFDSDEANRSFEQ